MAKKKKKVVKKTDKSEEFPGARVGFQYVAREILREYAPKGAYGPGMKKVAKLYDDLERFKIPKKTHLKRKKNP